MNIYFLGGGNMASAIAGGLVKQDGYKVHLADRSAATRERLAQELGATVSETLPELGADDVLVLAVKPQDMQAACAGVKTGGALVLSVAAGLSIATLSAYLGGTRRIVRVMPNTPAKIGMGVSGLFSDGLSDADKAVAERIMQSVGQTVWLESEDKMHNITGISGSGPAYVFYLLEALQNAAEQQGFGREDARKLSHEAVETFKAEHVSEAIAKGAAACVARSREMEQQFQAV